MLSDVVSQSKTRTLTQYCVRTAQPRKYVIFSSKSATSTAFSASNSSYLRGVTLTVFGNLTIVEACSGNIRSDPRLIGKLDQRTADIIQHISQHV
jgi:hypothetical protein